MNNNSFDNIHLHLNNLFLEYLNRGLLFFPFYDDYGLDLENNI